MHAFDFGIDGFVKDDKGEGHTSKKEYAITAKQYGVIAKWLARKKKNPPKYVNCTDFALMAGRVGYIQNLPSAGWFVFTPTKSHEYMKQRGAVKK